MPTEFRNIQVGDIIAFKTLKNARGYPLTGEVIEVVDGVAIINAYGLEGPGSENIIRDVPTSDLLIA